MKELYSHTKKKKLAEKIMGLKDKKDTKMIKNIIFKHNPNISIVKKSTGILMYFQNLENETYYELDKFIENKLLFECEKKIKNINSIENMFSSDPVSSETDDKKSSKSSYKYSNKEKNLIRRNDYERSLNEMNGTESFTIEYENYNSVEESEKNDNSNIFMKKIEK